MADGEAFSDGPAGAGFEVDGGEALFSDLGDEQGFVVEEGETFGTV